ARARWQTNRDRRAVCRDARTTGRLLRRRGERFGRSARDRRANPTGKVWHDRSTTDDGNPRTAGELAVSEARASARATLPKWPSLTVGLLTHSEEERNGKSICTR